MNEIYVAFHEYFEIVEVDSVALLEEVYQLRYRVYCIENKFLDLTNYPDGMEKDEYDHHSVHILLKHRPSGCFIGTARMVLQDRLDPYKAFPVEKYLQVDTGLMDINKLPRQKIAEISRFAVLHQFSRRRLDKATKQGRLNAKDESMLDRRRFPNVFLALAVGVFQMSAARDVKYWLSAMNPVLNRLLGYYGLGLHPIGPLIDYHGMRRPYFVKLNKVLRGLYQDHRDIWELVTDCGKVYPYPKTYIEPARTYDNRLSRPNLASG